MSQMNISTICSTMRCYKLESVLDIVSDEYHKIFPAMISNDANELASRILPSELERITLIALLYCDDEKHNLPHRFFLNFAESIRNAIPSKLKSQRNNPNFVKYLLASQGGLQFRYQNSIHILLTRYYFYFSYKSKKLDMEKIIKDKLGIEWERMLCFCYLCFGLFCMQKKVLDEGLINIFEREINAICCDKEDICERIRRFAKNEEDLLTCFSPLVQYPFVKYNERLFLPLLYDVVPACTSSIIFRITENDNSLREIIGKEVYEEYLYQTIFESGLFDEVEKERVYRSAKGEQRTEDVMCKKDDYYFLFDSKSFSPKTRGMTFDENSIDDDINRLSESLVQMYEHVTLKFGKEYKLINDNRDIDSQFVYGCVVIPEHLTYLCDDVFKMAANNLGIQLETKEYKWFVKHIDICPISKIEEHCLLGIDFMAQNNAESMHWFQEIEYSGDELKETHAIMSIEKKLREILEIYSR